MSVGASPAAGARDGLAGGRVDAITWQGRGGRRLGPGGRRQAVAGYADFIRDLAAAA